MYLHFLSHSLILNDLKFNISIYFKQNRYIIIKYKIEYLDIDDYLMLINNYNYLK